MLYIQSFTFSPVQENTYILYNDEKQCCIIDPGCYFASEEEELKSFIKDHGLTPVLLLNTHCHLDHIFGNRFVQKTFGLKLHLHKLEKQVLDYGPVSGQMWQLPFDNYDGELVYIDENDVIRLGSEELQVLFTPGHSPGHICFYSKPHKFLIGGDVLFNGSVGRTDLPGGDFATLEQSIKTKLYTLPEDVIVYPGHGDSTTIGEEMKTNPFVSMI
ncbi:MBL fold metallo-hydrolase [Chitinophagaceae bacterium LB-8]|uniref:MBL fold metallo-hydrolase n=1 Tax=Paraflavisolibacter caeni TaxID=2982496 RepID=A0A9X3BFD7_9BACT|nr:MBL fold metallo-hydrolase [Paraflavisolibacter caeni]MCU7548604.1 MBL fold metallo-hydrolase [Paraflavisolibacter caeni]